ncbi:MAG TPA: tetratricopeptide repeat protein [Flavobacteriales bacterium]|nr:tetratricopeptide repeat protein [Flavobacteriales bacterium]
MRKFIFVLALLVSSFVLHAGVDSLKNELKKNNLSDSLRCATLLDIALSYYNNEGLLDSSQLYFEYALAAAVKSNNNSLIAAAYTGKGLILREKGIYSGALENYLKAHSFATKAKDYKRMAKALSGIGVVHAIQGDNEKAFKYYREAEKINLKHNKPGLAGIYNNIGLLYSETENFKTSLSYYNKALKINEELKDDRGIATVNENIGLIYVNQLHDIKSGLEHYATSLSLWRKMGDNFSVSITMQYIASALNIAGKYKASIDTAQKALKLAIESKSLSAEMALHGELARAYDSTGNTSKAYYHYRKFIDLKESIRNDEKTREITSLQLTYDFKKTQAFDSIQNANKKAQDAMALKQSKRFSFWLICGMGLLLASLVFMYIIYQKNKKAKAEISSQKIYIEQRNLEVMDSIKYASRIQNAILPPAEQMKKLMPEHFVLYLPKDIVSGDFYWIEEKGDNLFFAVVDCTGHGVPGAFMSIVGRNGLNEAVSVMGLSSASDILNFLNKYVNETLHQKFENSTIRDGMDIALCVFNKKTRILDFAGANNPVWVHRANTYDLVEVNGDKQPIGNFIGVGKEKPFTKKSVEIAQGDTVYLFSDGYADQFGGPKGKKMKYKRLKDLIISVCREKTDKQREELMKNFNSWKGDLEQLDDVCVIGVKI